MTTEQQDLLLDILFAPDYDGDFKAAMTKAGYHEKTAIARVQEAIRQEMIKRCDGRMLAEAPVVINKLFELLKDPEKPGAKMLLATAQTWLDRAGIVKKEKLEIEHTAPNGVVLLPPKNKE